MEKPLSTTQCKIMIAIGEMIEFSDLNAYTFDVNIVLSLKNVNKMYDC